jgi:hypothetical protein
MALHLLNVCQETIHPAFARGLEGMPRQDRAQTHADPKLSFPPDLNPLQRTGSQSPVHEKTDLTGWGFQEGFRGSWNSADKCRPDPVSAGVSDRRSQFAGFRRSAAQAQDQPCPCGSSHGLSLSVCSESRMPTSHVAISWPPTGRAVRASRSRPRPGQGHSGSQSSLCPIHPGASRSQILSMRKCGAK